MSWYKTYFSDTTVDLAMKNFIADSLVTKTDTTGLKQKCEGESKMKYFPEPIGVLYVCLTSKSFRSGLLKVKW